MGCDARRRCLKRDGRGVPTNYGAAESMSRLAGRGDGLCKSFHATIVTAIAMGRCAAGTQQVLVPCRCPLQLKIQGPPGISHGPRSRSIVGEDLPCPSPVLGGESLIFSKSPSPSPAQAQPARMIPRHICSMPATCSTLVIRAPVHTKHRAWRTLGMMPRACTEPQGQTPSRPELHRLPTRC